MINKKSLYIGLVFMPVIIFLVWVVAIEIKSNQGREVFVRITGYDPRDLLSGHYINYRLDWSNTDCEQFDGSECPSSEFNTYGRFYVDEHKATELENVIAQPDNDVELVFSYQKGFAPLVLRLLVNGESWEKAVDKN